MADAKQTKTTAISTFASNPFPTNFNPPTECSGIYQEQVFLVDNKRDCLPTGFATEESIFYSPGFDCPTGYAAAPRCSRNDGVGSVTTVTCCPVRGDVTLSCVDDAAGRVGAFKNLFCTWRAGPQTVLLATSTDDAGAVTTKAATLEGAQGINAYGIRMVYQRSDRKAVDGTGEPTGDPTSDPTSEPTPSGGSNDNEDNVGGGLSNGAKVGIGVAVPLVVLAILAAAFLFWRRSRRRAKHEGENEKAVMPAIYANKTPDVHYSAVSELPAQSNPAELPAPAHPTHMLGTTGNFSSGSPQNSYS